MESNQFGHFEVSSFEKAKDGYSCNGDSFFCLETEEYVICAISDGLGSGLKASEVSELVISHIKKNHELDVHTLMEQSNRLLANKRGVVLAIIKVEFTRKKVTYSNIGNIACLFYSAGNILTRVVPNRGFLCGRQINLRTHTISYEGDLRFLLYTDGIKLLSSSHTLISRLKTTKQVLEYIMETAIYNEDDITCIVGDVKDES